MEGAFLPGPIELADGQDAARIAPVFMHRESTAPNKDTGPSSRHTVARAHELAITADLSETFMKSIQLFQTSPQSRTWSRCFMLAGLLLASFVGALALTAEDAKEKPMPQIRLPG